MQFGVFRRIHISAVYTQDQEVGRPLNVRVEVGTHSRQDIDARTTPRSHRQRKLTQLTGFIMEHQLLLQDICHKEGK